MTPTPAPTQTLTASAAAARLQADADMLMAEATAVPLDRLGDPFHVHGGPLGKFCESLHDLVAHVTMWDEIDLSVLTEERQGRRHWSLEPQWETPEAGAALNRSGVAAGRELDPSLVLDRFGRSRSALIAEVECGDAHEWWEIASAVREDLPTRADVAHHVLTVAGQPAFWHAGIHLGGTAGVDERLADGAR